VLIRTHGVGPTVYEKLGQGNSIIIDATCPYVQKAQRLAKEAWEEEFQVIILGDKNHPEVKSIKEWTNNHALVVAGAHDLEGLPLARKVAVLAQTTEKEEKFKDLVEYLQERVPHVKVLNTICSATRQRQDAVKELAKIADIMVVVGGKESSNTRKLWEICEKAGVPSYLVEDAAEVKPEWFRNKKTAGIAAGASTPQWIIEEVIKTMEEIKTGATEHNEANFTDMNGDFNLKNIQVGEVIKGTVVKIANDEVLVDIGGKSEGIIPATELAYRRVADPKTMFSVGQEIMVEVLKEDKEGNIILSRKRALADEALAKLEEAKKNNAVITAPVIEVVKGGLLVDVGIRGFVPASQVERTFVDDLSKYLHQELRLKVIELDKEKKKAVLSQRVLLEEEYREKKNATWANIAEGQTRKGIVKRLTNYGAFVDIGGVEGLLHVSEMGWGRISHPSQVVKEGDEIEVYILKLDREKEKVSLGLKQLIKSPWEAAKEKYAVGMVVQGKVVRIAPFGAFVELEPGVDGLIHISQLANKRVNKVEDVVTVGQKIQAKIIDFDPDNKRISLSLKDVVSETEKNEFKEYLEQQQEETGTTIGDVLKEKEEN
ncbi:MAG: bifunctional 4-hydroxy-3-methylbut-2-enyl diphosphate reductase/30S ribosomal protein S1, partial [Bacillota bacterium]